MKQELSTNQYKKAEKWCKTVANDGSDFLFDSGIFDNSIREASRDLNFPLESLHSFLRNVHVIHVKKKSRFIKKLMFVEIVPQYVSGESILSIAKKHNYPPTLVARGLIESITIYEKKNVTHALMDPLTKISTVDVILEKYRDSECTTRDECLVSIHPFSGKFLNSALNSTRLAREAIIATNSDSLYGPRFDKERNYIGIEYELTLERALKTMNIPFENEEQLRERGTSKTPDILLSTPVAIRIPKSTLEGNNDLNECKIFEDNEEYIWKMVCWIDSKALFGDVNTHQISVLPQAESYINRFGPGLILYWLGHAPRTLLQSKHGDLYIHGWDLPTIFLLPTGDRICDGNII